MTWPPCGSTTCPVPEPRPELIDAVPRTKLTVGTRWWRASRHDATTLAPPASGDARFSPLEGSAHAYFGATRTVALLESPLAETSGPDPTIYVTALTGWAVTGLELTEAVPVADLSDPVLAELGIARGGLVATEPRHHPCTRQWARRLRDRTDGPGPAAGIRWHSRQAQLHAQSRPDGVIADVVHHSPAEVAVVWSPPGPRHAFTGGGAPEALVTDGRPSRLVVELSALTGAPIE